MLVTFCQTLLGAGQMRVRLEQYYPYKAQQIISLKGYPIVKQMNKIPPVILSAFLILAVSTTRAAEREGTVILNEVESSLLQKPNSAP